MGRVYQIRARNLEEAKNEAKQIGHVEGKHKVIVRPSNSKLHKACGMQRVGLYEFYIEAY